MIKTLTSRWPLIHRSGIFLSAVVVAYLLASMSATRSVISSLEGMGVEVGLVGRINMIMSDFSGMALSFLPMIAAGYLAAFSVVAMLCRWWPQWRMPLLVLSGAVALVAIHLILKLSFIITPIAVGRTWGGLAMQGLAGAAGACVYAYLLRRK